MGIKTFFERLFGKTIDRSNGEYTNSKSKNGNGEGTQMVCVDCRSNYLFEKGEQKFFQMRRLTPPKRCPNCRSKRKLRR